MPFGEYIRDPFPDSRKPGTRLAIVADQWPIRDSGKKDKPRLPASSARNFCKNIEILRG